MNEIIDILFFFFNGTIILFSIIYLLLFVLFIKFLVQMVKKGPEELISKSGY